MRYVGMALAVAIVACTVVSTASAQTKWVRGSVVSTGPDTVTVQVGDGNMTFKVDSETQLIAHGAGTATREAQRLGAAGIKFTDFVKAGEGVEIHYRDIANAMTATEIRTGVTIGQGVAKAEATGSSLFGKVTAIAGDSVTVNADGKDWVFMVHPKTTVVGTGIGTMARELKASGKEPSVKDLLRLDDMVTVNYDQQGQQMMANDIYVRSRAHR